MLKVEDRLVLTTPACDGRDWWMSVGTRPAVLALITLIALVAMSFRAQAAEDADSGPLADFYSYLPATPELKIPDINIPFWTDDLKKGQRAYRAGKYDRALKSFRKASDDGNTVADWYLGHMYRLGQGVPRNDAMAYSYYSRVADSYDPDEPDQNRLRIAVDAMVRLADYQREGIGEASVKSNPAAAARSYLKIATAYGHPAAQYALGVMNIKGQGVKRNPQQGLKWLMTAARKRYAPAEAYLGELYWEGKIVRRDRTRAVMWYALAKESARPEENPEIYDRALQLEANVSEEELIEAEARARVWDGQYPVDRRRGND